MTKSNNKKSYIKARKKIIFFSCLLLLLVIVILSLFFKGNFFKYKVTDRVSNIEKFQKKNTDYSVLGWIKVQGTNIDYPVIHEDDVNKNSTDNYVWTYTKNKKLTNRTIIMGHNYLNVSKNPLITDKSHSRFEQLVSYIYYDFITENKYIQYTIDGKNYLFKIFAVSIDGLSNSDYINQDVSKDSLNDYIKETKENSFFDFDVDVSSNDKILTLTTCTRMYGRYDSRVFKIDARLVRDGESTYNYKVSENKNYKEIKKIMKGDDINEKA